MSVRLIAGHWGGRRLRTPHHQGLRPTPGVVRERLFNWLQGRVKGATVLDLFAGSGALGLEAWSRGAARVDFVERDRGHRALLLDNLALCGLDARALRATEALPYLRGVSAEYDGIFLDPPFAQGWPDRLAPLLLRSNGPLRPGAWLYLEANAEELWRSDQLPPGWTAHRQGRCGDSHYLLWLAPEVPYAD